MQDMKSVTNFKWTGLFKNKPAAQAAVADPPLLKLHQSINQSMTEMFVEQPLASPGSAKEREPPK